MFVCFLMLATTGNQSRMLSNDSASSWRWSGEMGKTMNHVHNSGGSLNCWPLMCDASFIHPVAPDKVARTNWLHLVRTKVSLLPSRDAQTAELVFTAADKGYRST